MLRPWKFVFSICRNAELPVHLQIVQYIIEEIRRGRLTSSMPLPGSRELAVSLAVNRKTVVLAYDELIAQGWIRTQGRRGTFISPDLPAFNLTKISDQALGNVTAPMKPTYELYGTSLPPDLSFSLGTIDFSDGVPDSRLIPFDTLGRAYRRALIAAARANRLAYGNPRGELPLRKALASMLCMERGLNVSADNICVVRGSQMGIYLAARILVRPGDYAGFETLTYPPAREAFKAAGAHTLSVAQDRWGMRPDDLERLCRLHRVKTIYLTPHHQFPTTVMMSAERRIQLLALAEKYEFAIVEDDYDHEFHFSRRPMFPMASIDNFSKVIYVGSLSKVLAPGLRVGYIVGPPDVIDRCATEILLIDRQGNAVTELAIVDLMESGELKRHIRRALRIYEARRNLLAKEIQNSLSSIASFDLPEGGLALWVTLNPQINMTTLVRDALIEGVRILPGNNFADDERVEHGLRLGFGNLAPDELKLGVERLQRALNRQRHV